MGQIRVLIVEDNDIARRVQTLIAQHCGCSVDEASTGAQARDLFELNSYDLIFMDLGLPDADGIELAKQIRSTSGPNKSTPIVALTATNDSNRYNEAIDAGMNSFITKPFSQDQCMEALQHCGFSKEEHNANERKLRL